jgi:hypothetical protein
MKERKRIKGKMYEIYLGWERPKFKIYAGDKYEGKRDSYMHISFAATMLIPLIGIWFTGLTWWSLLWIPFFVVGYANVYIWLPIVWTRENKESEPYCYGFYLYGSDSDKWSFTSLWICTGPKVKCFHMPWEYDWYRTSKLLEDGTWSHRFRGQSNKDSTLNLFKESHPYHYTLRDGTVQEVTATIYVNEVEHRWRLFMWLSWFRKVYKYIDVEFSSEVGEGAGGYKGGTLGCSYVPKKGEEPWETLARMERERKFDR